MLNIFTTESLKTPLSLILYTYLLAVRTISGLLFTETATISEAKSREMVAVKGDNELAIVRIISK